MAEETDAELSKSGVSILLADIDSVAVKLAEFINKRATDEKSNHCPVIPMIFFTHDGVDESDLISSLMAVGGATKIINSPCPTKDLLYTIIEVLYKCKIVDDTYKELNEKKTMTTKYPYYPLFQSKSTGILGAISPSKKIKDQDEKVKDDDGDSQGEGSEVSLNKLTQRIEDPDDWTHSSSLLPNFVKEIRKNNPLKSRIKQSETIQEGTESCTNSPIDRILTIEASPIEGGPKALNKREKEAIEFHRSSMSSSQDSLSLGNSDAVVVDPWNFQYGLSDGNVNSHKEKQALKDFNNDGELKEMEKSLQLLQPSNRPTCSLLNPRKSVNLLNSNNDIYPFFNKPMPETSTLLTVGGLDKKHVAPCWDIIHSQFVMKEKSKETRLGNTTNTKELKEDKDQPPSSPMVLTIASKSSVPLKSPNKQKVSFSACVNNNTRTGELVQDEADNASRSTMNSGETLPALFQSKDLNVNTEKDSTTNNSARNAMLSSRRNNGGGGGLSGGHTSRSPNSGILLDFQASKAEKRIMALSKEVAPDIFFTKLIDIDFSNRKINTGELDILQKGMKLEKEGDHDAAMVCYTRAGANSKDAQLSKMLLGNLNFKMGKYMAALGFYTKAIKDLSEKQKQVKLDEFVAFHNRGIIYFRLGDDDSGVADIEKAVEKDPNNLDCRTLLSLAYRRMGKFARAIDECVESKQIRLQQMEEKAARLAAKINIAPPLISSSQSQSVDSEGILVSNNGIVESIAGQSQSVGHGGISEEQRNRPGGVDSVRGGAVTLTGTATLNAAEANDRRIVAIEVQVPEPSLRNSFAHKKLEAIVAARQNKQDVSGDTSESDAKGGSQLKAFKLRHGMRLELFQELFIQPSEVQKALLNEPNRRSSDNRQVICTALRLFPFLRDLSDSNINNLANVVEYRAVVSKDQLFKQNGLSYAVCFLLGGNVEVRMELKDTTMAASLSGQSNQSQSGDQEKEEFDEITGEKVIKKDDSAVGDGIGLTLTVGDISPHDTFGHIDFLFRHNNPIVMKELEDALNMFVDNQNPPTQPALQSNNPSQAQRLKPDGQLASAVGSFSGYNTKRRNDRLRTSAISTSHSESTMQPPVIKLLDIRKKSRMDDDGDDDKSAYRAELDRALAPGMFMAYHMRSMCEMLLIGQQDFERILLKTAIAELKNRISVIRSCGIFSTWSYSDQIRLARMGQVKTYRRGDIILHQGASPQYLYIIMKGLCKVLKRPNRTEMLVQRLAAAEEKVERHKLKYIYDHTLRHVLSKVAVDEGTQEAFNAKLSTTDSWSHVTQPEYIRHQLGLEIQMLESLKQRARKEDEREKAQEERKVSFSRLQSAAIESDPKVKEIATLQWPMIFGEACVLDPSAGVSRGSVTADTACDILMLHKVQLQTFLVDDKFLNRVKIKAVHYPADPDIVVSLHRQQEWKLYKDEVIREIPKHKWPPKLVAFEPFRG
eukprot:CAMPEP_0170116102 /NCGR_PEP_ID=MMETSP0020_2-20130122/12003_1 /TAXON_ID=98059 /ORGANISM="Dinobryon sp., Strain UTEXLB2267" /LENGTH=1446 /DNA_ID=CAMNT_0010344023 /DNA_START=151 /DNA_END=4491 /DNA_ORIENTATION=-